jgi:PQQ-like domain
MPCLKALRVAVANTILLSIVCVSSVAVYAQDVIASYTSNIQTGSIVRYRVADGALLASISRVYQLNGVTYLPTRVAAADTSSYFVVFGNRFLARLSATDGVLFWIIDTSVLVGSVRYPVNDVAVSGSSVFISTADPAGRIARYRATDGGLVWMVQRGIQAGYVINTPLRLAGVGTDWIYALLGSTFLSKIAQSDGRVAWQIDISLKSGFTTYGVGDIAVGGGYAYVSNIDPNGTVRKINLTTGATVWSLSRLYRVGIINYQATKMAVVGTNPVMLLFGDRYLFRLNALDGQMTFARDIGLSRGSTTDLASDIAAVGSP